MAGMALFALTGCQAIGKYKCDNKNWDELGQNDGARGGNVSELFTKYNDDCTAFGSLVDEQAYRAGFSSGLALYCTFEKGSSEALAGEENRELCTADFGSSFDEGFQEGLMSFCTAENGRRHGLIGGAYRGTCDDTSEQIFLKSYVTALDTALPGAESEIVILEAKMNSLNASISNLDGQSSGLSTAIRSAKKNGNKSLEKSLQSRQNELSWTQHKLSSDKSSAERDLARARVKAENMREMLSKWKTEAGS